MKTEKYSTKLSIIIWSKMADQIQESKLTIGDAYRMSCTLAEELELSIQGLKEKIRVMDISTEDRISDGKQDFLKGFTQCQVNILSLIEGEEVKSLKEK